jgi:hypothetical protein
LESLGTVPAGVVAKMNMKLDGGNVDILNAPGGGALVNGVLNG